MCRLVNTDRFDLKQTKKEYHLDKDEELTLLIKTNINREDKGGRERVG
jgi:hypothetical protein